MNLEKNRKINFKKEQLNINHPSATFYKITFLARDKNTIHVDFVLPKGKISNIIVDFPEYKVLNKNYLELSRYSLLNTAAFSLHIRGQAGDSENSVPCSYFPFVDAYSDKIYYEEVFQDALDVISLCEELLPQKEIYLCGVGQGAAISIVCAALNKNIKKLFLQDCSLCYLENIYKNNNDIDFYSNIRLFTQEHPDKEDKLLNILNKIDVKNYAPLVKQKVYYALSYLDEKTPLALQEKLITLFDNIEVKNYNRLEYKKIFQHSFDDFLLKVLSEEK